MHWLPAGAQNIKGEGEGWEHKSEENCQEPLLIHSQSQGIVSVLNFSQSNIENNSDEILKVGI